MNRKSPHKLFKPTGSSCPICKVGELIERKSRYTGEHFIGCSRYPVCTHTKSLYDTNNKALDSVADEILKRAGYL